MDLRMDAAVEKVRQVAAAVVPTPGDAQRAGPAVARAAARAAAQAEKDRLYRP